MKTPEIRQRNFIEMVLPGHLAKVDAYLDTPRNKAKTCLEMVMPGQ